MTLAEQTVYLEAPVPGVYADELSKKLLFVSDAILGFEPLDPAREVRSIRVRTNGHISAEDLGRKIAKLVATDILPLRISPAKVVWEHPSGSPHDRIFERLLERGTIFEAADGQVGMGEPLIWLIDYLDRRLSAISVRQLGASPYRYPTLIPAQALARGGYLAAFPQHVMFVTRLHTDLDEYRRFAADVNAAENLCTVPLDGCYTADYCLPPTMCFHTYHQLRNRSIPDCMSFTARGKSFRFESRYASTLERLWDFEIRETVFLGDRDFVERGRHSMRDAATDLMESLDLGGRCEVASDLFFAGSETVSSIQAQRLLELKYELRLDVAPGRTIAVGSFNFHDRFFGRNFDIRGAGDEPVFTACTGFGLERLAYAFLCQHGIDEESWPDVVREDRRRTGSLG